MKYLTETETNILLKKIQKDNESYGIILKLMYLYGKTFNQIILLKTEDITENTIKFNDNTFPLKHRDYLNLLSIENNEYIFLKDTDNINEAVDKYRKNIIYYLNNNLKQLKLPSKIKWGGISLTDLRRLRGQHLILKGVDLKLVMELYQQQPSARTQFKKYLKYDELYKLSSTKECENLSDVFNYCTDTDVFQMEDFDNSNQYIVDDNTESTLVLLDYDTLTFIENVSDKFKDNVLNIYQNTDLVEEISVLQPTQYKLLNGIKFIKV